LLRDIKNKIVVFLNNRWIKISNKKVVLFIFFKSGIVTDQTGMMLDSEDL